MVVYGNDGLDLLTTTTTSTVMEWEGGFGPETRSYVVDPTELGLTSAGLERLRGGDAAANAEIAGRVLEGERGPLRDLVLLNSAAGLVVAGHVRDLRHGLKRAADVIDGGSARRALRILASVSQQAAENED
jgi:anthranilate phosphoribosyltransferase